MIQHSQLLKILKYCPETGEFHWLIQSNGRVKCGSVAGSIRQEHSGQACVIQICGMTYRRGRLAWFYVTGCWPVEVDHKDCDRLNDRWVNLRECSGAENQRNKRRYKNNKTGFKGVFLDSKSGKFRTQIQKDNRRIDLGMFDTAEAAFRARAQAVVEHHGQFARVA